MLIVFFIIKKYYNKKRKAVIKSKNRKSDDKKVGIEKEMTEISGKFYKEATSGLLSVQEAVDFLEKEAKIRTLREKLEKFSYGKELRTTLVNGLVQNHPDLSKDSIERRVRGWLNNQKNESVRKKDAIEICFLLELSVEDADALVALISEERLHWRSPSEIAYIFALKQGMTYLEAQKLDQRIEKILSEGTELKTIEENQFTPIVQSKIEALDTEKELLQYLKRETLRFGKYHNNAYQLFMDMIAILEHPELSEEEERAEVFQREKLTIRDILKEYLYAGNVLYAKEAVRAVKKDLKEQSLSKEEQFMFTVIQEKVSSSWPDETTLSKMKSRKADVTRKVLILLFLATDSGLEAEEGEDEPSREEVFADLYQRLNDMLLQCGFSALDPRSPFDWLILYCICAEDIFDVEIRMKEVFKEMFGEKQ